LGGGEGDDVLGSYPSRRVVPYDELVASAIEVIGLDSHTCAAQPSRRLRSTLEMEPIGLRSAELQSYLVMYPRSDSSTLALESTWPHSRELSEGTLLMVGSR
jgi:hypothetical protein